MELKNRALNIGVLLPHTRIYGGVKRYLELGNCMCDAGNNFTIFSENGEFENWFLFKGEVKKFSDLENEPLDILFFSQTDFLSLVMKSSASRKIFYLINPKVNISKITKLSQIEFFANSSGIKDYMERKYKISVFPAYGGINLSLFQYKMPKLKKEGEPFIVMVYGRISKPKKGTMQVVKACEKLYKAGKNVRLLLFDSPTDVKAEKAVKGFRTIVPHDFVLNHPVERNFELFHRSDVFVSAETSGGWSNTSAEAMASGTPVIATNVGTRDFVLHEKTGLVLKKGKARQIRKAIEVLMEDYYKRKRFSFAGRERIKSFDWEILSRKILNHIGN